MTATAHPARRRLFGLTMLLGLVAGASVVGIAAPAQAVPGLTVVSVTSIATSSAKAVEATCPLGTFAYGASGRIVNGNGEVLITDMVPDENLESVRVQGVENDAYSDDWRVVATAICAPDNGHNLERVEGASTANGTDLAPRSAFANCDDGQVVFGTGFRVDNAGGNVLVAEVEPNASLDQVEVEARTNGGTPEFDLSAYAVCGDPNGSTVELVTETSDFGTDPSYEAQTERCPQGAVTGVGGKVTDDTDDILLDRFELNPSVTRVTVKGWDNDLAGLDYDVTSFAICAD